MKFYYTYILLSKSDNGLYIGYTSNIKKRVEEHNNGNITSTKSRRPFKLIYFEGCLSKELALKREKQLKTGFGRAYLKRRLSL
ncbi:GIY-YIG nuclease family protein [Candidatus Dojkabacteria bacterium]|uniref:GIY-YIG nuclease family protein n=1 Tax=Candidatus Dojkabacteria bacterium TaxID=2099670 RepID=A0A955ICL7_9BACT|nr:GIY-YIG nuclease family protein [Candidatus Dojkabacteria bacterium]